MSRALESGVAEALRDPELRASMAKMGWDFIGLNAKDFAAFLDQELPKLGGGGEGGRGQGGLEAPTRGLTAVRSFRDFGAAVRTDRAWAQEPPVRKRS